jgi:hypothetical protein
MSLDPEIRSELYDLLDRLRDSRLDRKGMARLDAIIGQDAAARHLYLAYVQLCASLRWARAHPCAAEGARPSGIALADGCRPSAGLPLAAGMATAYPAIAYLVVGVIFAAGLLAATAWKTPRGPAPPLATLQVVKSVAPPRPIVAKITRVDGCRWADPENVVTAGEPVAPGRLFNLKSGVLEVTYGIGVRVVVQGEANFAIDSCNSGILASLSAGNVTIIVDGRPQAGDHRSAKDGPAPVHGPPEARGDRSPRVEDPSRVFALRIPWRVDGDRFALAAIVCGRGTEFKMRYDRPGKTSGTAVRGPVKLEMPDAKSLLYLSRWRGEQDKVGGFDADGTLRLVLTPPARPSLAKDKAPPQATVYTERKKIGTPKENKEKIED